MSRINLDQLRTFLAVVRLGGVRKAAVALNLTQPAVSARIRNLEASLGCDLFDRSGGSLTLSKRGERLVGHAERFEHLSRMIEKDISDPAGIDGQLRLGVSETIAQCWLPDLIARLHRQFPKLEIEFNVDISSNLREALLNREIDLAILLGPISDYAVDNLELPGVELAWYVAAAAPPEDAHLGRPVLTYARHTRPYRELKDELLERIGPNAALFPSTSLSACFRLVEANLGIAALPRVMGEIYVTRGTLREFDPGWRPNPLRFTVSFLGDTKSHLIETAARTAAEIAEEQWGDKNPE